MNDCKAIENSHLEALARQVQGNKKPDKRNTNFKSLEPTTLETIQKMCR